MRFVAPLILAFLIQSAAAAEDCHLKRIASLPMTVDDAGGVLVPMTIAGAEVKLLLDTGGVGSMLTLSAARRLGLQTAEVRSNEFRLFGGRRLDRFATARDIDIGGLKLAKYEFLILPDDAISANVDGTLAPDMLLAFDDDFDFGRAKFNLISADHCPGEVVYWTGDPSADLPFRIDTGGHIELSVKLDGKDVVALLDTGASHSTMSLEQAEQLFGFDSHSVLLKRYDADDRFRGYTFPFKTLSFGGVSVINPSIELVSESESRMGDDSNELLLGMNVLRQLHLYIAYGEKKLYVTAASAH